MQRRGDRHACGTPSDLATGTVEYDRQRLVFAF